MKTSELFAMLLIPTRPMNSGRPTEARYVASNTLAEGSLAAQASAKLQLAFTIMLVLSTGLVPTYGQSGTNPIPGSIPKSSTQLKLENVIRIPNFSGSTVPRLETLSDAGDGSGRLYVADQHGKIYSFLPNAANPSSTLQTVLTMTGNAPGYQGSGSQRGLRSFAFHPNYDRPGTVGFRKLYTAHSAFNSGSPDHDSVVAEWTVKADGTVDTAIAPREILRVQQPRGDHNIGQIRFNPNLSPTDSDYGNLYIAFGDGGNYRTDRGDTTLNPNGQNTNNLLGSIVRIDPATPDATASTPYTIPDDNPFVGMTGFRPELWAYGLRNPHTFSWDIGGDGKMLIGDIGQSGIEEVNLGKKGANYGWSVREGTFSVAGKLPLSNTAIAVDALSANHATDDFTYPVAQYDHSPGNEGNRLGNAAIVGGFVYRGTQVSELSGKYLFGDFANNSGPLYMVDVDALDQQEDFSNLLNQDGGYLAPIEELGLLNSNDQPTTMLQIIRDTINSQGLGRTDIRFGQGADGEVYVLNKRDGWIRRFVGTPVPEPTTVGLIVCGGACLVFYRRRVIRRA